MNGSKVQMCFSGWKCNDNCVDVPYEQHQARMFSIV